MRYNIKVRRNGFNVVSVDLSIGREKTNYCDIATLACVVTEPGMCRV